MMGDLPENEVTPLTEEEITTLRQILKTESHVKWFWSSLRVWSVRIGLITAGWYSLNGGLKNLITYYTMK